MPRKRARRPEAPTAFVGASVFIGGIMFSAAPIASAGPIISGKLIFDSRQEDFRWNIGDTNTNVLSELTWQDLRVAGISGTITVALSERWQVTFLAAHGEIQRGTNRDSDFAQPDRAAEFSRSDNRAEGETADLHSSVRFVPWPTPAFLEPGFSIGLTNLRQKLEATHGFQSIPDVPPYYGPFPGLNNSYDATWTGPWVGVDARMNISPVWTLTAGFGVSRLTYRADANWNLRNDFAHPLSFRHNANGKGQSELLELTRATANSPLEFGIRMMRDRLKTGTGVDTTFLADGTRLSYSLNEARSESLCLGVFIGYRFIPRAPGDSP